MSDEQSEFWGRLWEINDFLTRIVNEFEVTFENFTIKQKLPSVQLVYMHEIIINLWMILGNGRNDKFRLSRIAVLFKDRELQENASTILNGHSNLIEKLDKNRNWISAHLDSKLTTLKFSENHVKKFEERFKTNGSILRAGNRSDERYTPDDMRNDLTEIKQILKDVKELWESIIPRSLKMAE